MKGKEVNTCDNYPKNTYSYEHNIKINTQLKNQGLTKKIINMYKLIKEIVVCC